MQSRLKNAVSSSLQPTIAAAQRYSSMTATPALAFSGTGRPAVAAAAPAATTGGDTFNFWGPITVEAVSDGQDLLRKLKRKAGRG
ncbi:MAG: hypothetical protein KC441_03125 [Anaerolineales bacterium]|nr:hypothetical protein [Anaerolineales bacterium]